jgi:hypothetical protein
VGGFDWPAVSGAPQAFHRRSGETPSNSQPRRLRYNRNLKLKIAKRKM